jgi:hypothetical protein
MSRLRLPSLALVTLFGASLTCVLAATPSGPADAQAQKAITEGVTAKQPRVYCVPDEATQVAHPSSSNPHSLTAPTRGMPLDIYVALPTYKGVTLGTGEGTTIVGN